MNDPYRNHSFDLKRKCTEMGQAVNFLGYNFVFSRKSIENAFYIISSQKLICANNFQTLHAKSN